MPPAKGTAQPDGALSNSFRLDIPAAGSVFFITVGSIEEALTTTVLADQTAQTTGKVEVVETDAEMYIHHKAEYAAMEAWYSACKAGAPGHKQTGILHALTAAGVPVQSWLWTGVLCKGRTLPAFDAGGDGEVLKAGWKLSIDAVSPL